MQSYNAFAKSTCRPFLPHHLSPKHRGPPSHPAGPAAAVAPPPWQPAPTPPGCVHLLFHTQTAAPPLPGAGCWGVGQRCPATAAWRRAGPPQLPPGAQSGWCVVIVDFVGDGVVCAAPCCLYLQPGTQKEASVSLPTLAMLSATFRLSFKLRQSCCVALRRASETIASWACRVGVGIHIRRAFAIASALTSPSTPSKPRPPQRTSFACSLSLFG